MNFLRHVLRWYRPGIWMAALAALYMLQGCGGQAPPARPTVQGESGEGAVLRAPGGSPASGIDTASASVSEAAAISSELSGATGRATDPIAGVSRCADPHEAATGDAQAYKHAIACHVHRHNRALLFDGPPPPVLKSIVVLSLKVDHRGQPSASVLRSNGIRELERRALQTVRDASPLPVPQAQLLRRGTADITETWLFRDDGMFQLRSLAAVQASSSGP